MSWRNKSAFCPRDILFFFLKQLFTGYAEDRQTRLKFLINVAAYLPVFQSNEEKLTTRRLTLCKTALTSTLHVSHRKDMTAEMGKPAANAL